MRYLLTDTYCRNATLFQNLFCRNQICLANTTSLSILANGLCSICEMLYDHPEYILGSVRKASISEIWNSEKALNLYSPQQENIESDSPCKTCEVFSKCKNYIWEKDMLSRYLPKI
ncbi:SPASM domain-containing protein (plasmid) [Muribaculum gordoncarteri]|uniref:SPASM domain-containing protein n=1 Tax=Muribaculum gordoncarteri TaxID=2530390 RepID=A0A4P7VS86_9BACT|nr:SPASM domain-containing protein [Muribaculum gordoncarteri]